MGVPGKTQGVGRSEKSMVGGGGGVVSVGWAARRSGRNEASMAEGVDSKESLVCIAVWARAVRHCAAWEEERDDKHHTTSAGWVRRAPVVMARWIAGGRGGREVDQRPVCGVELSCVVAERTDFRVIGRAISA